MIFRSLESENKARLIACLEKDMRKYVDLQLKIRETQSKNGARIKGVSSLYLLGCDT
jgi:hypothetical protein